MLWLRPAAADRREGGAAPHKASVQRAGGPSHRDGSTRGGRDAGAGPRGLVAVRDVDRSTSGSCGHRGARHETWGSGERRARLELCELRDSRDTAIQYSPAHVTVLHAGVVWPATAVQVLVASPLYPSSHLTSLVSVVSPELGRVAPLSLCATTNGPHDAAARQQHTIQRQRKSCEGTRDMAAISRWSG